jgi:hypothetical protein
MTMNRSAYSESEPPWNGDLSKLPDTGTLVAIPTGSSGLVNKIVRGYKITWRGKDPVIRIIVDGNERLFQDIETPLTIREKKLLDESFL